MRYKHSIMLVLIAATLGIYWRTGSNGFVSLDDYDYVVNNVHVQAGLTLDNVRWAFTAIHAINWHPLTWLSHMADCQMYGLDPRGHHFTSIFLHVTNTVLLFFLLARMTGALWRSAFVAALFALHPLHVESVAWVAERKDVLSTMFFLLTLLAYTWYTERPGPGRYLAALCAFALGLMAKPMLVTLPFVLFLLDYWPLDRYRIAMLSLPVSGDSRGGLQHEMTNKTSTARLITEKVPFFLLSIASSTITLYAQKTAVQHSLPLAYRSANALLAYAGYLGKTFWPSKLAVLYPLPTQMFLWCIAGAFLLLACVTVAVFRLARRAPYLPVGWLWYLGTLVPVIGLVQVGVQSMADRYTYIPLIGIFVIIAWGTSELAQGWRHSRIVLAASAVVSLLVFSAVTWQQIGYWRNNLELFTHALRSTTGNYTAHDSVGRALADQGQIDEAISHYQEALRINPSYEPAHVNLAFALFNRGKVDEAIGHYLEALQLSPDDATAATAHNNLGIALTAKGEIAGAINHFSAAVRINPDYGDAHYNLALALAKQGRIEEAVHHYLEAQRINPTDSDIRRNLELALSQLNKTKSGRNRQ